MKNNPHEQFIPKCEFIGQEIDLENHILNNIKQICINSGWPEFKDVKRQFFIKRYKKGYKLDILVIHSDLSLTVIEVKKKSDHAALSQLLLYKSVLKHNDIDENKIRLVFATPNYDREIYFNITDNSLPIDILCMQGDQASYIKRGGDYGI